MKFADGIASLDDVQIDGPAHVTLTGTASVPSREFDMKGTASLVTGDGKPGFELPFVVQGPWDDPLIFPDPDALLRRSPATAPLLKQITDPKARDAVRSVIERLTGAKPQGAPQPTNAPAENASGDAANAKAN